MKLLRRTVGQWEKGYTHCYIYLLSLAEQKRHSVHAIPFVASCVMITADFVVQEASLSQRGRATVRVVENFTKSLMVTGGYSELATRIKTERE